ncbi:exodeoxyribonuclease VII large subunit [Chloroflexota bacterium]
MQIYTVGEVTTYARELLDSNGRLSDLWVKGEISNLYKSQADHLYFTIKDATGQLKCVLFKSEKTGITLENGMAVIVHGRLSIYELRGDLQVYVDMVQPEGVGVLHLAFQQLKDKLEKEGLFEEARKRALPAYSKRIGVVTSPVSAAYRDIVNIISRRYPLVELIVAPTLVQGNEAAPGIVRAIDELNDTEGIGLIILARGGGSLEDLWAFNEEIVARAIYASKLPIISGVGHETDFTIADYVADMRAPTPSAAAEIAAPDQQELKERILSYRNTILSITEETLGQKRERLKYTIDRVRPPDLTRHRQRIDDIFRSTSKHMAGSIALSRSRLAGCSAQLNSLDPLGTLNRGYAIVQKSASGKIVSQTDDVRSGEGLVIQVSNGQIKGKVTGKSGDGHQGTLI